MCAGKAFSGSLQFFPPRLQLSDTKRVTGITFRYKGDKPEKFRLSAQFWRMTPEGRLERVEKAETVKAEERPLMKYIRFSPREFELVPGAEQTVQVMYSGPGGLPEGEYRTQLLIEPDMALPEKAPAKNKKEPAPQGIKFEIDTKIAYAIPVIFRRGKPQFAVKLEKPAVKQENDGKVMGTVELVSTGTAWPYGDVEVFLKDVAEPVGVVRGIAGYVDRRRVDVPLTIPVAEASKGLKFVFKAGPEAATQTSAEVELAAGK